MAVSRFELPTDATAARDVCLAQRMPTGDTGQVRSVALRSGALAAELRSAARVLVSGAGAGAWRGPAQQALADTLRAKAPHLEATATRYESYAVALTSYAATVDTAGPRLRWLRSQLASRAGVRATPLAGASSAPEWTQVPTLHAGALVPSSSAGPAGGPAAQTGAVQAAAMAAQAAELRSYARQFKTGYDEWADALDRCCFALLRADAEDPTRDPHGLAALGKKLDRIVKYAAPIDYLLMHPSLKNASDCLGILSTELSVIGLALLFICPPAGAACLTAATVVAAAQLATDVVRRSRGEHVSATTLGFDAMAALPIGGKAFTAGRDAGRAAHALEELGPGARNVSRMVPGGGLAAHEGPDLGHTLAKHVGKSEEFLVQRLVREPAIDAVSTFSDRETAESAIADVLRTHDQDISRWLSGSKFQLILDGSASRPVGRVLGRGNSASVEAPDVRLILRRSAQLGLGYYIRTAMVLG